MYSSYTTLQRAQLAKQEYLNTQEVFLGCLCAWGGTPP